MPRLQASEMAGNHGGQVKLPGFSPVPAAYFPQ
jgi:hypothetical protein